MKQQFIPKGFEAESFSWSSDIHITNQSDLEQVVFGEYLRSQIEQSNSPIHVISGDLGWQGQGVAPFIKVDAELIGLDTKVLFIRGNHDLKDSDVKNSDQFIEISDRFINIHQRIAQINHNSCIIGHNGAPDFRAFGENLRYNVTFHNTAPFNFPEILNVPDGHLLEPLEIGKLLRIKADLSTDYIIETATDALTLYQRVYILTHYPPFAEACIKPEGSNTTSKVLPALTNINLGKKLIELMSNPSNQSKHLEVLCGHTHQLTIFEPLHNLKIRVAKGYTPNYLKDGSYQNLPKVEIL